MNAREVKLQQNTHWCAEVRSSAPSERVLNAPEVGSQVILAIDSALGSTVAVSHEGQIFEVSSDESMRHAEVIGGLLVRAFQLAGTQASAVEAVTFGVGPGPFTGLRVGISAAQTFAFGVAAPLLPQHSHEAVALAALEAGATSEVRVVQDAKRRELFISDYRTMNWAGVPVCSHEPRIVAREAYESVANELWPQRVPAARLVQLAARKIAAGMDFEKNEALYLRQPDVRPPGPVKRVTA